MEEIDAKLHDEYLEHMKNKVQTALIETINSEYAEGYTENYVKVYLSVAQKEYHIGDMVKIKLGEKFQDGVMPA